MFNMGFLEILVIGIVALIVIGPKQLPEVARVVARLINEFRRATGELSKPIFDLKQSANQFVNETKNDLKNEFTKATGIDDLKKEFDDTKNTVIDDLKKELDELPDDYGVNHDDFDDALPPHDEFGNAIVDNEDESKSKDSEIETPESKKGNA